MDNGKKAEIIYRSLVSSGQLDNLESRAVVVTSVTAILEAIDTVEAERGA